MPKPFLRAREQLGERIVQYGYLEAKEDYVDWLKRGTVVVSTAIQENFGISVVEAIRHGCFPLLPNNLSYPELIPEEYHSHCLCSNQQELVEKLSAILEELSEAVECEAKLTRGPIDDVLILLVKELQADLLVMGSHGWSTPEHQSLTEKMIAEAKKEADDSRQAWTLAVDECVTKARKEGVSQELAKCRIVAQTADKYWNGCR